MKERSPSKRPSFYPSVSEWFKSRLIPSGSLEAAPRRRGRDSGRLSFEPLELRAMLAGDAPFLPVFQLETVTGVVSDPTSGHVSLWQDLSGNSNDLIGTGESQPTLGSVLTPTGQPAVQFDGLDDRLIRALDDGPITGLPESNDARTLFLVAQFHDADAAGGASYGRFGNYKAFGAGVDGPGATEGDISLQVWGQGNDLVSAESAYGAAGTNGWVVISVVHNNDGANPADNGYLYVDGQLVESWDQQLDTKLNVTTLLHGKAKSRIVLGEEIRELGHIQMDVAAWLVYDDALDPTQRGQVEDYLTNVYLHPLDQPPVTADDSYSIANGAMLSLNVLVNDTDIEGSIDPTTVQIVDAPTHATVSINPTTGVISYSHNGGGQPDSFTYTVRDVAGNLSNPATVAISISGMDQPPVAIDDRIRLDDGATIAISPLVNDGDADGTIDVSTVTVTKSPTHAALFSYDAQTGSFTYQHDGSGLPDSFEYQVRDNSGVLSNVAAVSVAVNSHPLSLAGFAENTVFTGSQGVFLPVAIDFLPDGRLLILQKDGVILIADPNSRTKSVYATLTNINIDGERGLLEIAVDPDFDPDSPGEDHIYLYYTPSSPQRARIARFTHQENAGGLTSTLDTASEFVVWQDTDGYIACCHYGGGLDFGPDGKLWLTSSDKFTAPNPGEGGSNTNLPQDLTKAGGKIIRVNPDGTAPDGTDGWPANPFVDPADDDPDLPGNQQYHDFIWAYGLRNPFRASWDLETGRFFMGEVGGNVQSFSYEDVHVATLDDAGANFGWPNYEGPGLLAYGEPAVHSTPIYSYAHNNAGASLTGGEVYRGSQFPAEWQGVYFFGDFTRDTIRYLTFDSVGNVTGDFDFKPTTQIPGDADQIVSITVAPDGALYYALIDGRIRRTTYTGGNSAPSIGSASADVLAGPSPLTVTFSASVSDPNGDPLTYVWQFGDGQSATGAVVSGRADIVHTFTSDAIFTASLEVTDGLSTVYSAPITIRVGQDNVPPVIETFTAAPTFGTSPLDVTFAASFSDLEGDDLTYEILYGDGQTSGVLPVPENGQVSLTRTYSEDGSFNARVRVSDGVETVTSATAPISVGQTQLPPVTQGLVVLLESDIKLSVSQGDIVAAWLDGSGSGNNLDAFGDPRLVFNATPGGQPAIVFDGDGDKLERLATEQLNNLPGGSSDRTIFTVVQYVDMQGVTAGVVYGRDGANRAFGLTANGSGNLTVQGYGLANDFVSGTAGVGAGWLTQSVVVSGGTASQYKDGALLGTFNHTYNTVLTANDSRIVIGEEIGGLGYSQMAIGAMLVYDRALTPSERAAVEGYLNAKYFIGNSPPVARNDSGLVATGAAVSIDLLANDSDSDGVLNPSTVQVVTAPAHGTVTVDPLTGIATYQHDGGSAVNDTFTYRVNDEVGIPSGTATVSITIVPGTQTAENQAVVRWHGDYYQYLWNSAYPGGAPKEILENRWLRGGPAAGSQLSQQDLDLDNDGSFDDSVVYFDFSLSEPLNPLSTTSKPGGNVYHDDMPSATFYGGLSASYYNYETDRVQQAFIENDGAGGALDDVGYPSPYTGPEYAGLQAYVDQVQNDDGRYKKTHVGPQEDFAINLYRPDLPHPLDPSDNPSDNLVTFAAAFLWKKEDFLAGGASQRVSLDGDSSFSFESTRWWDNVGEARWILQDQTGQLYISEYFVSGQQDNWGHTNEFVNPLGSRWAEYNVAGSDLAFDSNAASWIDPVAAGLFSDIQAVGVFIAQPTPSNQLTKFSLDEITFNAVVGEAAETTGEVPVTSGLVVDLNAGAGVVTGSSGGVTGWLDSSGNGNDLQSAVGEGELVSGATPSGLDAIHLDAGEGLFRDGSVDALNGAPLGAADRTLFFVVQYTGATSFGGLSYGSATDGFGLGVTSAGSQALLAGSNVITTGAPGVTAGWLIQSVVVSQNGYKLYSDGVLIEQGVELLNTSAEQLAIGASLDGVGGAGLDVASALVFDRALSEMERQEMQAYLHNRFLSPS
ncbi:Ig-like domain-containing protein [Botrimarina colliarenosi]|uniref:Ig-like domain-containing protein n=1 Tax=Botrimarina colliarenosi TaxID=2528001 RepID=UPI0018D3269B|nr:PQQ-dependent sugar dehydrogenase [Botrimarina colliarenosi]